MHRLTDEELIAELLRRMRESRETLALLRELNEKLEAAETTKDSFLSNIRNEINNPLTAVTMLVETLRNDPRCADPGLQGLMKSIADDVSVLDSQLQNIFLAAELEAGAFEPAPSLVDVAKLASDVMIQCANEAAKKNIQVRLTVAPEVTGPLAGEQRVIRMILQNLLANAIGFGVEHGHTEIQIARTDDALQLIVQDDGVGVAAADQARIFDRFVQLSSGRMKASRGHGLGLSLVRSGAELLGGHVEMQSEPGQGTRFRVTLPIPRPLTLHVIDADGTEFWDGEESF